LVTAAGLKTLEILKKNPQIYTDIDNNTLLLEKAFINSANNNNVKIRTNRVGSLLTVFFTNGREVFDYRTALESNLELFKIYFKNMFEGGIYIAPSQFETLFMSNTITNKDIQRTLEVIELTFQELGRQ
jgi:glutamate-1-semialdehyde 2,1-aminomutase